MTFTIVTSCSCGEKAFYDLAVPEGGVVRVGVLAGETVIHRWPEPCGPREDKE